MKDYSAKELNEMYGKATNEILKILEGLPICVARHALDVAKSAINENAVVQKNEYDYTGLPYYGV